MSTLTSYTSANRPTASSNTGLCIFRSDTNAIEVSDGTSWQTYNSDGVFLKNGYSVSLDGSNDYVDVSGVASSLNSASAFTVSLWYNTNVSNVGLISGGTSSTNGFWLARFTSSTLYFNVRNGGATFLTANVTNADNTWHHVAAICDGSSSKVYVNGNLITTGTLPSLSSTGANGTAVGYIEPLSGNYFSGNIDEVAIWDSALSGADVASLIDTTGTNPVPADISSLSPLSWWRMGDNDGGTGTTVTDQGSGSNNATLTNGAYFSPTVPS